MTTEPHYKVVANDVVASTRTGVRWAAVGYDAGQAQAFCDELNRLTDKAGSDHYVAGFRHGYDVAFAKYGKASVGLPNAQQMAMLFTDAMDGMNDGDNGWTGWDDSPTDWRTDCTDAMARVLRTLAERQA